MKQPAKKSIASRNGGNGGYSKKQPVPDPKLIPRNRPAIDYHGNRTGKSVK